MGKAFKTIKTVDYHTGGEPLRIIVEGYPELPGKTILEKRQFLIENLDFLRTGLIFEPRGHFDMYACLPVDPEREDSDFGMIFMHNEGYSTMCGHAVIAMGTYLIESGKITKERFEKGVMADTPAGQILIRAYTQGNRLHIGFENVPSYVFQTDLETHVDEIGKVEYQLAYGGAFYALIDAPSIGLELNTDNGNAIRTFGMKIKERIMKETEISHPLSNDLAFLYGVIFIGPSESGNVHSRNVCVFADGEIDRSPTGTGVSSRIAYHHLNGDVRLGEEIEIESIIGTGFCVKALREVEFHGIPAIIPEVSGQAFLTGKHEFIIDEADPLAEGFLIR